MPWYRRLLKPRQAPAAGERRRIPRPSVGGSLVLLAVLAVALVGAGLAYASVPSLHRQLNRDASSITTQLRRSINPSYTPVRPPQTTATSEVTGHPAAFASDLVSNDYWAADVSRDRQPTLAFKFARPTDLDDMLLTSGAASDFARLARPRTVRITYSDGTGQVLTLKDDPKPTSYTIEARHVSSMTVRITSVYPASKSTQVAISEVELFRLA